MRPAGALAVAALLALAPLTAAAEPKGDAAAPDRAPRVRASHRVDVIGPGERVETAIDRFRADRQPSPPPRAAGAGERLPVRGPDRQMEGRHIAPDHRGADGRDGAADGGGHRSGSPAPGTAPPGVSPPGMAPAGGGGGPGHGVPAPGTGGHRPDRTHR